MHSQIDVLLDEAETRYLSAEELAPLSQYVDSLPERLAAYNALKEQELSLMQQVADQLQAALPQEKPAALERSIKNALLLLRHCAIAMLLNDTSFVQERLLGWLSGTVSIYATQTVDATLYRLLNQRLAQTLTASQMNLLTPILSAAQNSLLQNASTLAAVL